MLKGVNKNVIEIQDTGNDCFERVILFVRPESEGRSGDDLHSKAKTYISNMRFRQRMLYGRGDFALGVLKLTAAMAIGATFTWILIK